MTYEGLMKISTAIATYSDSHSGLAALYSETTTMIWQLCIQYSNGSEKVLKSYKNRDTALECVDALYSQGYPMHVAYVVRHALLPMAA